MTSSQPNCRLYLVSPRSFDIESYTGILAETLDAGDVAAYQLRMPDASPEQIREAAGILAPIAQDRGVSRSLHNSPRGGSGRGNEEPCSRQSTLFWLPLRQSFYWRALPQ